VAISPQLPEHNRELIRTRHLAFEILTDRGNAVATKFGLRFNLPDYLRRVYSTFLMVPAHPDRPFRSILIAHSVSS